MKITQREAAKQFMNYDVILLGAVISLASLGLIMVLSASGIMAEKVYGDKYALFWKQMLYMALGAAATFTSNGTGGLNFGSTLSSFNNGGFLLTLSGTSTSTVRPASRTAAARRRYTSVLPLPVTP